MDLYKNSRKKIISRSSIEFTPLINFLSKKIKKDEISSEILNYNIIFLIVASDLKDVYEFANLMNEASKLGLSVFVIGIGENEFKNFQVFEGDYEGQKFVNYHPYRKVIEFFRLRDVGENELKDFRRVFTRLPFEIGRYFYKTGVFEN